MGNVGRAVTALGAAAVLLGCGGGDDGPSEASVASWLAEGNGGEEPGCPLVTADDLADLPGATTTWVGNDGGWVTCAIDSETARVGVTIRAADTVLGDIAPETDLAWTVGADTAVVVRDEVLSDDVRFVVVVGSGDGRAAAEDLGDAVWANLDDERDDVDGVTA